MFSVLTRFLTLSVISISLISLLSANIFAQSAYTDWKVKGDKAYDRAAYSEAVGYYLNAFAIGRADPGDAYNMACCYALIKDEKNAFKYLDLSIRNGWTNDEWMVKDSDLFYLHQFPEWLPIVGKTKRSKEGLESRLNKALKEELLKMAEKDQEVRKKALELIEKYGRNSPEAKEQTAIGRAIDKKNTLRLKEIVAEFGWPGKSLVGKEGAHAAWLIVQHADLRPGFQNYCLGKMADMLDANEISKSDYAYLYDRVKCAFGELQLYGTQAIREPESDKLIFQPIENESELDHRRAAMNISITAAEYAKVLGFEYRLPTAEEAEALHQKRIKKYKFEVELARKAVELGDLIKASGHYKSALILNGYILTSDLIDASLVNARLNDERFDEALWYLHKAISRGFNDLKSLEEEPGFEKLRNDARWDDLKSRF